MGTYTLNHDYESYRDGRRFGPWRAGDVVNLDDADAAWVERDSAGALTRQDDQDTTGPAAPEPAAGARPRVGGDPDRAEAAAQAQRRVHAESVARQAPDVDQVPAEDDDTEDDADGAADDKDGARQKRTARDRQQRGGRNRAG